MQINIQTKKMFCAAIIILIFLIASGRAQAIGFGNVQKRFFANVMQGETAESTILFFNIEDAPVQITMNVKQAPDNWIVKVEPETFLLEKSKIGPPYDGEYIGLPGIGDVKASPVRILVNVPLSTNPGSYDVFVTARSGGPGFGIVAMQERTFKLTVDVKKVPTFFEKIDEQIKKVIESGKELGRKISESISAISINAYTIILILLILAILTTSWAIYKHE